MIRSCIACLLGLFLISMTAHGARVNNLFQAEVDADGRGAAARDAALKLALGEVLIRITGNTDALSDPAAQELFNQPGRFVEQFRYREQPAEQPGEPAQLQLWVQFDGVALAREVRKLGLPYWGRERPDVLVWLAIDDRGQRYLVSETTEGNAAHALRDVARRRGLPLTLPLMDLEDQRAVQFTDVWGGFVGTLEAASQRYRPQVILVGKVGRSGLSGGWRAQWDLSGAGTRQSWTSHATSLEKTFSKGIAEATEWLAVQYALVASGEAERTLIVEGIQGLEDYARVSKYLASLTPVEQVQVARAAGQEVSFDLTLSAEERKLLQAINLGKMLEAAEGPSSWRFRLRR